VVLGGEYSRRIPLQEFTGNFLGEVGNYGVIFNARGGCFNVGRIFLPRACAAIFWA